jgi:hypothetical protein
MPTKPELTLATTKFPWYRIQFAKPQRPLPHYKMSVKTVVVKIQYVVLEDPTRLYTYISNSMDTSPRGFIEQASCRGLRPAAQSSVITSSLLGVGRPACGW